MFVSHLIDKMKILFTFHMNISCGHDCYLLLKSNLEAQ